MKPTFQIGRQSRHIDSPRPVGQVIGKSTVTDWHFQSTAELRTASVGTPAGTEQLGATLGLYAITQGLFDGQTKWEDRIEGFGLIVVTFLAAWPVLKAAETAISTAGYWW